MAVVVAMFSLLMASILNGSRFWSYKVCKRGKYNFIFSVDSYYFKYVVLPLSIPFYISIYQKMYVDRVGKGKCQMERRTYFDIFSFFMLFAWALTYVQKMYKTDSSEKACYVMEVWDRWKPHSHFAYNTGRLDHS